MVLLHTIIKRIFDILFSLFGLIIFSPFFLIIGLIIKFDSKGPVFFKQGRLGKNGKDFKMYKFRSMVENAEFSGTGLFNYSDDPRVTKVGKVLRNYSLDELPQIINIFKGDMSCVGPRPPVSYELGKYENFDKKLKKRFIVKPGVTGYAQINGRNELSWDEKIEFDLQYISDFNRCGILLDIKIIFITIIKVLKNEGSHELLKNAENDKAKMKL